MKIEINPGTLSRLESICEVLYKLHPYVLDYLLNMQRNLGNILGFIDLNNPSLKEREFISNYYSETDYSEPDSFSKVEPDSFSKVEPDSSEPDSKVKNEQPLKTRGCTMEELSVLFDKKASYDEKEKKLNEFFYKNASSCKNEERFYQLKKYLKLDTYEYIPIKIFIEIEDPVVGKKVRELVRALETTRAIDEFTLNKIEIDEDAYFAEGYGLEMNNDQRKQMDDFFENKDVTSLRKILIANKLY